MIKEFVTKYINEFNSLLNNIEVSAYNKNVGFFDGIQAVLNQIKFVKENNKKIIFVGNGGSAGIVSHIAVDFWKNGGIKTMNFNEASLLTCISNDYSFENVFEKPIEFYAEEGDVIICISSSGNSENILNAAKQGRSNKCKIITLSGFAKENKLSKLGDINFYTQSNSYGIVETAHAFILHILLDAQLKLIDNIDVFNKNKGLKH